MKTLAALLAVALCLSIALPAGAAPRSRGALLDEPLDLSLKDAKPGEVFSMLGQIHTVETVVDPSITTPVTLELTNVRTETILHVLCESVGCRWRLEGDPPNRLVVEAAPPAGSQAPPSEADKPGDLDGDPLDLALADAAAAEVFTFIAQFLDARLDLDDRVTGPITLTADNLTLRQTLDRLCADLSCAWELRKQGSEKVLRIWPA